MCFGFYLKWNHDQTVKLAKQMEQKIDGVLASNEATLQGALNSFNTVIAQKNEKIAALEVENITLQEKEKTLLARAVEQEAAVQPILEQFPEVAKLVFTLKETIATVQTENANLRIQLTLTQDKYMEANKTIVVLRDQNVKLTMALEEVRADVHKALSINKGASTGWKIMDLVFKGVVTYVAVFK
jgi:chromosome segregation ATPase